MAERRCAYCDETAVRFKNGIGLCRGHYYTDMPRGKKLRYLNDFEKQKEVWNHMTGENSGVDPWMRRKCPSCGSRNYYTSHTGAKVRTSIDGKATSRIIFTDAGSFHCNDCGFDETSWGWLNHATNKRHKLRRRRKADSDERTVCEG